MPGAGFEPARLAAYAPQTYVSANSTTRANIISLYRFLFGNHLFHFCYLFL